MKLKTTMLTRYDGKHVLCVGCDAALGPDEVTADPDATHDAAAAHALMRAMEEIEGTYADCAPASDIRQFLRERADELMREWGFGEAAE